MSRVILQRGRKPIIIVAPHEDDFNTDIIADVIASELQAYCIINKEWQRVKNAIPCESRANLNSIEHCNLEPCRKEFLHPLMLFKDECIKKFNRTHVFYIHGMANRKNAEKVDIVLGFGQGLPPSYTCHLDYKNALTVRLGEERLNVYQAKPDGRFAARKPDNLTQLWRAHYWDQRVSSMQMEIVNSLRSDPKDAVNTALRITRSLDRLLHSKTMFPRNMKVKEY